MEDVSFKSGKDLGGDARDLVGDVSCVGCGRNEETDRAIEEDWQFDPVVCPACIRWEPILAAECCTGGDG